MDAVQDIAVPSATDGNADNQNKGYWLNTDFDSWLEPSPEDITIRGPGGILPITGVADDFNFSFPEAPFPVAETLNESQAILSNGFAAITNAVAATSSSISDVRSTSSYLIC